MFSTIESNLDFFNADENYVFLLVFLVLQKEGTRKSLWVVKYEPASEFFLGNVFLKL